MTTLLTDEARSAIAAALQAAAHNSPLPAFNHLRIENAREGFRAVGCDGRLQVTARAPALGGGEFAVCVHAERLGKVLGSARGDVTLKLTDKTLAIASGGSRFSLPLFTEDFPLMPPHEASQEVVMPAELVRESLARVLPFAADSDVRRPMLEGMAVQLNAGELVFVATDGAGMAVLRREIEGPDCSTIIPGGICRKLKNLIGAGDVKICIGTRLTLDCGDIVIDTPKLDFVYLDWTRALPAAQKGRVVVDAEGAAAVFAEALIVSASARGIAYGSIDISAEGIEVAARGDNAGDYKGRIECSPSIPAKHDFNLAALREVFSLFPKGREVTVEYGTSGPFVFKSDSMPGYTAVFMPARI